MRPPLPSAAQEENWRLREKLKSVLLQRSALLVLLLALVLYSLHVETRALDLADKLRVPRLWPNGTLVPPSVGDKAGMMKFDKESALRTLKTVMAVAQPGNYLLLWDEELPSDQLWWWAVFALAPDLALLHWASANQAGAVFLVCLGRALLSFSLWVAARYLGPLIERVQPPELRFLGHVTLDSCSFHRGFLPALKVRMLSLAFFLLRRVFSLLWWPVWTALKLGFFVYCVADSDHSLVSFLYMMLLQSVFAYAPLVNEVEVGPLDCSVKHWVVAHEFLTALLRWPLIEIG